MKQTRVIGRRRHIASLSVALVAVLGHTALFSGQTYAAAGAVVVHPSKQGLGLVERSEFVPLSKASALMAKNRYQEALPLLEEAIERNPANILANYNWGTAHLELAKQSQDALEQAALLNRSREAFERVVDLNEEFVLPYFKLGKIALMQNDIDGAKSAYQRGLQNDPKNATLVFNLARVYDQNGERAEAIRQYLLTIKLDSNFTYAYNNLALVYEELHRYDEAEKAYHQALQLDKRYNLARMNLANLYATESRYADSRRLLEEALKQEPGNALAYYYMGNLHMRAGHLEEAVTAYQHSLALDPDNTMAYYLLAVSYSRLKRNDEALQAGLHYLRLEPEGKYAREMQSLILTSKLTHKDEVNEPNIVPVNDTGATKN